MNHTSLPDSGSTGLPAEDAHATLLKVHLLRQREDFDAARLLLEQALVLWPHNDEVRTLLLQTEKDQLATRPSNKAVLGDIGLFENSWQMLCAGLLGTAGAGGMLWLIARNLLLMARFGVGVQQARYTRGMQVAYYVPVHLNLTLELIGLSFIIWLIWQVMRSLRA